MLDVHFTIAPIALLPPTICTVAAVTAVSRARRVDLRTIAWRGFAVIYLALLLAVTMFPFHVEIGPYAGDFSWMGGVNMIPLVRIDPTNFVLNILMTAPLGVFLPALTPRQTLGQVVLTGAAVSIAIEMMQYATLKLLSGGRTIDVNDVLANILGVALGYAGYRLLVAMPRIRGLILPAPTRTTTGAATSWIAGSTSSRSGGTS